MAFKTLLSSYELRKFVMMTVPATSSSVKYLSFPQHQITPRSCKSEQAQRESVFLVSAPCLLTSHCPKQAHGQVQVRIEENSKLHGKGCAHREGNKCVAISVNYHEFPLCESQHGGGVWGRSVFVDIHCHTARKW